MAFSRKFTSQPTLKMKKTFCKRYHTIYDKAIVDLWINFISTFIFIKNEHLKCVTMSKGIVQYWRWSAIISYYLTKMLRFQVKILSTYIFSTKSTNSHTTQNIEMIYLKYYGKHIHYWRMQYFISTNKTSVFFIVPF